MKTKTDYQDLIKEVIDYFHTKVSVLQQMGVTDVIPDPGFGFAKTIDQNFSVLSCLEQFKIIGRPILAGLSRKSMIWKTLDTSPAEALNGTTALNMTALIKGVSILRVHDVREAMETVRLYQKIL